MIRTNIDGHPWYREPWPWILMSGPALVVVAAVVTAWIAIKGADGLVSDDYYKQGLAVNQVLGRDKRAGELGLKAELMRSEQQIRVLLTGGARFLPPDRIVMKLSHPTRSGEDQTLTLTAEGAGFYTGKLSAKVGGRWSVSLEDAGGQWRLFGQWLADAEKSQQFSAGAAHEPADGS